MLKELKPLVLHADSDAFHVQNRDVPYRNRQVGIIHAHAALFRVT